MQVTIDKFGRMVLPKPIRDDLGLMPGSVLEVEEQQESIVLRPVRSERVVREKDGVLVYSGQPEEDLGDAVVRHRQERLKALGAER